MNHVLLSGFIALVLFALVACSGATTDEPAGSVASPPLESEPEAQPNDLTIIQLEDTSAYNLDFHSIVSEVRSEAIPLEGKVTLLDPRSDCIDFAFKPDGTLVSFAGNYYALSNETQLNIELGLYKVRSASDEKGSNTTVYRQGLANDSPGVAGLTINLQERVTYDKFDKGGMPNLDDWGYVDWFADWYASLDLSEIINSYTIGNPTLFRFRAVALDLEDINQPGINIIYLDCTSTSATEVDPAVLGDGDGWVQLWFDEYSYFVIYPYYPVTDDEPGIYREAVRGESGATDEYAANNLIVLLVTK
ncbi:MAG: hypothetical protein LBS98_06400 [Coriobacteriales bacterium]|nr:hypothetical protein [Coriobacteriales bacterium]